MPTPYAGSRTAEVQDFLDQLRAISPELVHRLWEELPHAEYLRRVVAAQERLGNDRGHRLSASVHSSVVRAYREAMGELGFTREDFPGRSLPRFRTLAEQAVVSIADMDSLDRESYEDCTAAFAALGFRIPAHPDSAGRTAPEPPRGG